MTCPPTASLTRWLLGLGAAALLGASCSKPDESSESVVVLATVGDRQITADDFESEVQRRLDKRQPVPEKEELLRQMIEREVLLFKARQAQLTEDAEVKRMIENLLIGQLKSRDLQPRLEAVEVSDEELRQAYAAQKDLYETPAKARLAVLFQSTHEKMTEEKRQALLQRMEEGRQKALSNPAPGGRGAAAGGFGAVAIDHSEDQSSRYRGGDIGWLDLGNYDYRWPKPVLEAGYALDKGAMSEVISTDKGFYVVMKTDERPALTRSFEDVAASLRQKMAAEKREALQAAFQQDAERAARVETHPDALETLKFPAPQAADPEPSLPAFPVSSGTGSAP